MEAAAFARGRASREASPERVKVHLPSKPRKAHVIYYLCRNGQLEQPHFMEVLLLPHRHLRLKDFMERLSVLRGSAMISLYSWSCKRSYKNGYVWNDLAEDDVIYPSDGAEYILKGSEIMEDCREDRVHARRRSPQPATADSRRHLPAEEDCKVLHQCTPKPVGGGGQCSRGVSTEEPGKEEEEQPRRQHVELPSDEDDASPPSSASSSDKTTATTREPESPSDGAEPPARALSVLHHLIACGNPATMRRRAAGAPAKSPLSGGGGGRRSSVGLQRGVLCRVAAARAAAEEEEMNEIKFMSENPRFGGQQLEEKEYFSGSIVEAMSKEMRGTTQEPSLKKSSSYNEERSGKCRLADEMVIKVEEKGVRGGCIPSKKRGSSKQHKARG